MLCPLRTGRSASAAYKMVAAASMSEAAALADSGKGSSSSDIDSLGNRIRDDFIILDQVGSIGALIPLLPRATVAYC